MIVSVEELQGLDGHDGRREDPWERIARELDPRDWPAGPTCRAGARRGSWTARHGGRLDRQVASCLGWDFFPWQTLRRRRRRRVRPATRKIPAYRTVGVGVARQNGKTTLVCVAHRAAS